MESLVKSDGKDSPSAAGKKLKQTRLPFQILTGSPVTSPVVAKTTSTRKRKPSIEADNNRATKIGRTSEAKENVKDSADPVVVLDEENTDSTSAQDSAVVEILEDDLTQTPPSKDVECSGESASKEQDDKIKIKFPIGKKKGKKSSAGEEGSAKKKVPKEKKKHKKESKKSKVQDQEVKAAEDSVVIDDSELSDAEKEDGKDVVKVVEVPVDKKKEETKDSEPVVAENTEEEQGKDVEVFEIEDTSEESPSDPAKEVDEAKDVEKVIETDPAEVECEEQVNEAKKKVEDEAVTPRRTRLPRAATQKKSEPEPNKADQEAPKRGRSAKKSTADKKSEASTPKAQKAAKGESTETQEPSENEEKKDSSEEKQKPAAVGALDKLFAKIQTENKTKSSNGMEAIEIQKTPEKKSPKADRESAEAMEVDQQEATAKIPTISTISVSICLDDSTDGGADADDEENAYMLCTPNSKERSLLGDTKQEKKLTPKQIARRKEAEQRQAAKNQELEEKKKKKEEEKEAKLREKEEQERLRKKEKEEKEEQKRKEREEKEDQKRKEREEKEEQKRKEREDKERKRLAEVEAKNEEKRKKEEQKEEERKKKEEEKEAEEKRKQKTAQAFQSFFVKKSATKDVKQSDDENSMDQQSVGEGDAPPRLAFMPFFVMGDMRLAPVCRVSLEGDRKKRLEEVLGRADSDGKEGLYLRQLKNKDYVIGRSERTGTAQDDEADDDDVMIVDDNVCHQIEVDPSAAPSRRYRAKYFMFEENRRPPYRGTWRKRSNQIKPRRPFVQDTKFFDYEVDSDDEWEEEEPGELVDGSDDDKDVDPEEEYEVDNDFFVPHGHLSDEEMQAEDDVMDDNSPETQKAKLKIMQQEFAAEMKKKTEKIKPRLIGCLWENGPGEGPECSAVIWEILKARAMFFDPEEPISFTVQKSEPDSNQSSPSKEKELTERKPKQVKLVDEGVKELITLIHGRALNRKFLIKEFLAYWAKRRDEGEANVPQYAQDSIRTKILEVASWRPCPDEGPMQNKMCWYVNKEALVKYGLTDLKVPTGWEFILKPITKSKKEKKQKNNEDANGETEDGDKKTNQKKESPKEKEKNERLQSTPSSATKPKPPAAAARITKFTKKLSEDEKRKQFAKAKKVNASPAPSPSSSSRSRKSTNTAPAAASPSNVDAKPAAKKRVQLLMSVPRGQNINQTTKSNLISQFLAKAGGTSSDSKKKVFHPEKMEVDPPVVASGSDATIVIVLDD